MPQADCVAEIDSAAICLGRSLGSGNFGEALLAQYLQTDVVVKKLKGAWTEDNQKAQLSICPTSSTCVQEFLREVDILKGCRHPHIIGYLGVARHDQELW